MTTDLPPASDLLLRFGRFVGWARQAIVGRLERGGDRDGLGPLGLVLWSYLGRTVQRLAALQARFEAGTLAATPRDAAPHPPPGRSPVSTTPATMAVPAHGRPALPRGPVLLRFHAAHLAPANAALIADPQMQALLAATPKAGRLLRPLWRRLTPDRLPDLLRPPARPRKPRPSRPSAAPASPRRAAKPAHAPVRTARWVPHWAPTGPQPPPARLAPLRSG